jgi:sugar/nucleoside kinase (ribokinase family)
MACHEVGGGNAANASHAFALLSCHGAAVGAAPIRVQLATKVGSDAVGVGLLDDLQAAGVEVCQGSIVADNSTTAVTTVLVGALDHTRTCIYTPGTCGEWSAAEVREVLLRMDSDDKDNDRVNGKDAILWNDVCHFHSDARHTEAALYLARQALQRHIPVSLDVEKDRGTTDLDDLLILATFIFTNAEQLEDYLQRLTRQAEETYQRRRLANPVLVGNLVDLPKDLAAMYIYALRPSTYFTRWFQQVGKEIVITKGSQGSIHVRCDSVTINSTKEDCSHDAAAEHEVELTQREDGSIRACQTIVDPSSISGDHTQGKCIHAIYTIQSAGILPDIPVVDTTGAGDSFLGGYLAGLLDTRTYPTVADRLRLAAWVAGHKIQGPGARTTLPTAAQRERELGSTPEAIQKSLRLQITDFGGRAVVVNPLI